MSLGLPEAEQYCRAELGANATVVNIQNGEEEVYVTELLRTTDLSIGRDYWLGLRRADYKWADGNFMTFDDFWISALDGADCFYYDKYLSYLNWNHKHNCSASLKVLCEIEHSIAIGKKHFCRFMLVKM